MKRFKIVRPHLKKKKKKKNVIHEIHRNDQIAKHMSSSVDRIALRFLPATKKDGNAQENACPYCYYDCLHPRAHAPVLAPHKYII